MVSREGLTFDTGDIYRIRHALRNEIIRCRDAEYRNPVGSTMATIFRTSRNLYEDIESRCNTYLLEHGLSVEG